MDPILQQAVFFGLQFLSIFSELLFFSIFAWVMFSWLIMFGITTPDNRFYNYLGQLVYPILKPFRWARIGMLDLSPLMALAVLGYLVLPVLEAALVSLQG